MHAREWITTMVTEYIAYSLLRQYKADADVKHALDSFDFYIFPVVNPDGACSHPHSTISAV
jgi:murein tripeptide amidase MpaA